MTRYQGSVIPAKAGIQANYGAVQTWIPACAGMTRQAERLCRESHPFSYSVDISKILIRFVVITFFTVNPQEASISDR